METFELTGSAVTGIKPRSHHLAQYVAQLPTTVKLGRRKAKTCPTLKLEDYFEPRRMTTPPPASINRRDKAAASIAHMYLNNQYGCCVISGKAHSLGVWSANDSDSDGVVIASDPEIFSIYQKWCGVGDNGCWINVVLDNMRTEGFTAGGKIYKIDGYIRATNTNKLLVQVAQFIFGATTIGISLPKAWMSSSVWDVTETPIIGGHDVTPIDYDDQGVYIASWGRIYLITWAAFLSTRWIDEYYIILAPLWYGADKINSTTGIDVTKLQADLAAFNSGTIPDIGATPFVSIISDENVAFTTTGDWLKSTAIKGYFGKMYHTSVAGDGSSMATWDFTVAPGTYKVATTWTPYSNRATNAPFTVLTDIIQATVPINQRLTPTDFPDAGFMWKNIGTYTVTGTSLKVKLSNNANNYVIADAVRIEKV